ncbi:MAG: hypothetical protein AAF824_20255 [Bacteroidota bacterium]
MAEYAGVLLRHYQIPIKQFVVYLGEKESKMQNSLSSKEVISGFNLISLNHYSYKKFLGSQAPEVIVLGILSDFEGRDDKEVSRDIIQRLHDLSLDKVTLEKHIDQLEILSNLRNLNEVVYQTIKDMPFTIDISKSRFYQEGVSQGKELGKELGRELGQEKEKLMMIQRMLREGMEIELIAKISEVSPTFVKKVQEELFSNE